MSLVIIALEYMERSYVDTVRCIEASGYPVIYVSRDGVGNMSRAFNEGMRQATEQGCTRALCLTNVTFAPHMVRALDEAMEQDPTIGAIQPGYNSDHRHLVPVSGRGVTEVPFVELTCTAFKLPVTLNDRLWYYYMDLDVSERIKQSGLRLCLHNEVWCDHVYLRNGRKEPITRFREQLRLLMDKQGQEEMERLYGPNWKFNIWHKHINERK